MVVIAFYIFYTGEPLAVAFGLILYKSFQRDISQLWNRMMRMVKGLNTLLDNNENNNSCIYVLKSYCVPCSVVDIVLQMIVQLNIFNLKCQEEATSPAKL